MLTYYNDAALSAFITSFTIVYLLIIFAVMVICIVAMWMLFLKAGEPGWASIIPFYSSYVLYKIAFGNGWLFLLLLVPCANIVVGIMMNFKLATAFGKGVGFGFGLLLLNPIFMLILAFGEAKYIGAN